MPVIRSPARRVPHAQKRNPDQEGDIMSNRTPEEKTLLAKLASGLLDGSVGTDLTTTGGSTVWARIKDGTPARRSSPTSAFAA